MGYCPFSSLSHDTMDCIMTQGVGACCRGATTWPGGPTTRPVRATTRLACAHGRLAARARGLASGVCHDTNIVS